MQLLFASVLAIVSVASGAGLGVTKCVGDDAKCIKEQTASAIPILAAGLPEYGIEPLDPVHFKLLDASTPTLKLILRDVTATGLKNCKPKKMQRDVAKSKLYVRLICDVDGTGHYEMKGRLLVLPIEGNDKFAIKLRKVLINADLDLETVNMADGKPHWNVKDWKYSYELKEKADILFENLFPGNEVLGRAARDLVRDNGNEIVLEVGPPIVKVVADKIVANVNKYFKAVPLEELTL